MNQSRFPVLIGLIVVAAASRLVPHVPNFSPIAAMALFSGAHFADKRFAFLVPFVTLFLSDLVLGFYAGMTAVYGSFALIVCLGFWLRSRRRPWPVAGASLAASILFFGLTNFALWTAGVLYPLTAAGLARCFAAAVPFFQNTVAGDLFYAAVLFGGFALAERIFPAPRDRAGAAA